MKQENELQKMKKAELIEYIQELQKELEQLKISNSRGAGRKETFTKEEIEKILQARAEGKSMRVIARENLCSVGLIHKLISERKEEI